jgi:hypothetical protein
MQDAPANGQYTDTGWQDITPVAASSNKGAPGSRWGQYRCYANGIVMLRGLIERNSGNWGVAEKVGSIPPALLRGQGDRIFAANISGVVWITSNGDVLTLQTSAITSCYLDGIIWGLD